MIEKASEGSIAKEISSGELAMSSGGIEDEGIRRLDALLAGCADI